MNIAGGVFFREGKIIREGWGKFPQKYESSVAPKNESITSWTENVLGRTGKQGLLVLGPPGTGKSYEATGAVRRIVAADTFDSVVYTEAADFHATIRGARGDRATFDMYAKADVLVMDDFYATSDRSDWMADIDYQLINYRYNFDLPLMIVANLKPGEVADAFGSRITSRLRELATMVILNGEDRRGKA